MSNSKTASKDATPSAEERLAALREWSKSSVRPPQVTAAAWKEKDEEWERAYKEQIERDLEALDPETWEADVIHKLLCEELSFWRRAYAATLDPETIEVHWSYGQTMEPYGDYPLPAEMQQVQRHCWVTALGSPCIDPDRRLWVVDYDFARAQPDEAEAHRAVRAAFDRQRQAKDDPEPDHFHGCPRCPESQGPDDIYHAGKSHTGVCHTHRTSWWLGSNLISSWGDQTEDEQRERWNEIANYEDVG